MRATAREQSRAFFMEGFDHEPANQTGDHRTCGHGADTAWGRGADAVAFLTPVDAVAQISVPNALSVEWQGQKLCEKLYEDAQILIARCTFPPGSKHLKHSHPGYLGQPALSTSGSLKTS